MAVWRRNLCFTLLFGVACAADVNVNCDKFVEGQSSKCTCVVDKAEVDSPKCINSHPVKSVTISMTKGRVTTNLCVYEDYAVATGAVQAHATANCTQTILSTTPPSTQFVELTVSVLGNKNDHEGATVDCQPSCLDAIPSYGLENMYQGTPITFYSQNNATSTDANKQDHTLETVFGTLFGVSTAVNAIQGAALIYNRQKKKKGDGKPTVQPQPD